MTNASLDGLELSRLMLGTAQFGMNYGIANKVGQPTYEQARDIIAIAYEGGVNCIDTAAVYGSSEEIIGRALAELKLAQKMVVVTKVQHMAATISSSKAADEIVEESVVQSLKRLQLDFIPICLFHRQDNMRYVESLLKMKEKGLVRRIGTSITTPEAAAEMVASGQAEAMQLPTSVLDYNYTRSGIIKNAADSGIAVFVRSVYLQGLILLPDEEILPELSDFIPVLQRLRRIADDAGIELAELALRYVLGIDGVTSLVIGVDTVAQMRRNLEMMVKGPLDADLTAAAAAAVPDMRRELFMPQTWSKRMPDVVPKGAS